MKQIIIITLFILYGFIAHSQSESNLVFNFEKFMNIVRKEHPISRQAQIKNELGALLITEARGAFDPKIESDISQKYFKGNEYYDYGQGILKVPTWFGVELEGGYERNEGVFLNPESTMPNGGLWFAGISVPIGEGLFIDERRASLRKAQVMVKQNEAQRDLILNDLLFEAGKAYWLWFNSFYQLQVNIEALQLAKKRFFGVKQGAELGDIPSIDTLESGIQVQNRKLNLQQAKLEYKNTAAYLETFLWQDGFIPLELDSLTTPEKFIPNYNLRLNEIIFLKIDSSLLNHPEIRNNRSKQEQLSIDKRWAKEQLKPKLNLKYKPITEASGNNPFTEYSINNYTWGLQFEFPIFLRKERAKLKQIGLKLEENSIFLENKKTNLTYKLKISRYEFETTQSQIKLYEQTVEDYRMLLLGERSLFNSGESSLFMINSRELGFIKAELKMVELVAKNRLAILKLKHALGQLQ